MPDFIFARSVKTYDIFRIPAESEAAAREMFENADDPDAFFEGEGNDVTYGDLELETVEAHSVTALLTLIARHAGEVVWANRTGLPLNEAQRQIAQLEWLEHLLETQAEALDALPESQPYLGNLATNWTDQFGSCWCFSPSTALWELLSLALQGGFPTILERHARDFCILHGSRISGLCGGQGQ